eukprot:TRINITY_DN1414_c0_g1_i1.p1 TRINITY_DN1414_c0_g1~~TRINITY_DN1414_c0_g1_i1.p1  ORF type:complete len:1931 (+),score=695.98 TRINITY_DN1414_c0_g1_i1:67-5859(+)
MRSIAAALCCAGFASAQFLGVTPPRILATQCPSVGLLPLTTADVATSTTAQVGFSVEAWCGNAPVAGLAGTQACGADANWVVYDDGEEISTLESELTVQLEPGSPQTLILIDLSNSVSSILGQNSATKTAVVNLLQRLFNNVGNTGPQMVAIHAFDGRRETQMVHDWSSDVQSLVNSVTNLECNTQSLRGGAYCRDPSTNLYGTLVWAAGELNGRAAAGQNVRRTSRGIDGAIAVFTDGDDLAGHSTAVAARAAIRDAGVLAFAVGVLSSSQTDWTPALQRNDLLAITGDYAAAFLATTLAGLPQMATEAGNMLALYFGRSYRITYCSPRRSPSAVAVNNQFINNNALMQASANHYVQVRVMKDGTMGPEMEYIPGQNVHYATDGATWTNAQITGVTPGNLNNIQTFYSLNNAVNNQQVPAGLLRMHYSSLGFSNPTQCPLKLQNTQRTAPCTSPAVGELAPYSCTGGGLFECGANTCSCPASQAQGQCSVGNCVQEVQKVVPPLYIDRACASGLPAGPQAPLTFTRSQDSTLSLTFAPQCNDGSSVGGLTFSPCPDLSSITVEETDPTGKSATGFAPISLYESRLKITCVPKPAHIATVMLLDMSGSVLRGFGALQRMKDSALAFLDGLSPEVTSHMVEVYTFDGSPEIRLLSDWGSVGSARSAIASLECGVDRCIDPSTNLNGAVLHANARVLAYLATNSMAADGHPRQGFIALFSDGADQARYYTDAAAEAAARNGNGFFAVGIQGEVRNGGTLKRGADTNYLRRLAPSGTFVMTDVNELREAFKSVGTAVQSAAASSYRLEYCSPKRSGMQKVRVYLSHHGASTFWEVDFNADFQCNGGACNRCLGGIQRQGFTCGSQPTVEDQNFACLNNENPVSVDGYCRCPCANPTLYPPASVPGPGPIICEKQGTCARGNRVDCAGHGGLGSQVREFTRFGINKNSRVSMEFTPTCADDFPMPLLRLSVCESLSDFRVLEFNPDTGVDEPVSKFESLPNLQCFPDVTSIILLDTSGSVRFGGGEQAIRDAVIQYIDRIDQSLTVKHSAAIYSFDGRDGIQVIQGFSSNKETLKQAMNNWQCDNVNFCADPSTNLYGAVEAVEQVISREVGDINWRQKPYLILFTDGTDQAGRVLESSALAQLQRGKQTYDLEVYGVGLIGETNNGLMGLDRPALDRLAPEGVFVADALGSLTSQFDKVAQDIVTKTSDTDSTTYRIDYCSPKRRGSTRVTLVLQHNGQETRWVKEFNADTFDCSTEACGQCLDNRVAYSCQDQPGIGPGGGEQQFFTCVDGDPLVHDGQCKCPCPASIPYPPPATWAPMPGSAPTGPQSGVPIFTPSSGTFAAGITITITCPAGMAAHYTSDGSAPTVASPQYLSPIQWTRQGVTTMQAICVSGTTVSPATSATYQLGSTGTTPNVPCASVTPAGFVRVPQLNQAFTIDTSRSVGGQSTYRSADGQFFMYYCVVSVREDQGNQWRIAQMSNYQFVSSPTNPVCNSVARSGTTGPSLFAQTGPWTERAITESTFTPVTISFPCIGGGTGGSVFGTVLRPAINVNAVGQLVREDNVVGSIAGTNGAAVTGASCLASNPSIFSGGQVLMPISGTNGGLTFTPVSAGTSTVTCTLTDTLGRSGTLVPITVSVLGGGGGSGATLTPSIRLPLRTPLSTFNAVAFLGAIRQILGATWGGGRVNHVCPRGTVNPPTAACRTGGEFLGAGRGAAALQTGTGTEEIEVDFDLLNGNGAEFSNAQYQAAINSINADASACWNGRMCMLRNFNPVPNGNAYLAYSTATPAPPVDADDDDGMAWWHWLLIVLGVLLCCSIIAALIIMMTKGSKSKDAQPAEQYQEKSVYEMSEYPTEREPAKQDDYTYATSYGDYSQAYGDAVFAAGERVDALYLDGQWYPATIDGTGPDGTYGVRWATGEYSDGIPADQIRRV